MKTVARALRERVSDTFERILTLLILPDAEANIRERLNLRDFMETLRARAIQTGGPSAMNQRDRQAFSNALDRFLARNHRP